MGIVAEATVAGYRGIQGSLEIYKSGGRDGKAHLAEAVLRLFGIKVIIADSKVTGKAAVAFTKHATKEQVSEWFSKLKVTTVADIGVDSPRGVWSIVDDKLRGQKIEQHLGQNLPDTFKTIDRFDNGTAVSIKGWDLTKDSKQATGLNAGTGLFSALKTELWKLKNFEGYRLSGAVVRKSDITSRVLRIGIPHEQPSLQQLEDFGRAADLAKEWGIRA